MAGEKFLLMQRSDTHDHVSDKVENIWTKILGASEPRISKSHI